GDGRIAEVLAHQSPAPGHQRQPGCGHEHRSPERYVDCRQSEDAHDDASEAPANGCACGIEHAEDGTRQRRHALRIAGRPGPEPDPVMTEMPLLHRLAAAMATSRPATICHARRLRVACSDVPGASRLSSPPVP